MPMHLMKISHGLRSAMALGTFLFLSPVSQAVAQAVQADVTATKADLTYPSVEITAQSLEYRQFERVEITGSAILAKEAKEALPLQIIDRREIERSGATSLPELLQRLPIISNSFELGTVTGTTAGGPEAAAIHGNQSGTLVLLNGRRLPYYGSSTIRGERSVVDLNFMPLAAIEKIEILTDGASSRYGSDAMAGVINVITKAEVQGFHIGAETSLPQYGHGQGKGLNLSWGNGRLRRDGYSLRAHFMAQKSDAVLAKHREPSSQGARSIELDGKIWWQNYRSHRYSAPAQNYLDSNGVLRNDHYLETGKCPFGWNEINRGECLKNVQGDMTLYPETRKQLFYLQGDWVMPNQWVLFAEALSGRQNQVMIPDGTYWPQDALNSDGSRTYLMDLVPLGLIKQQYANRIQNVSVGLRGEQYGWDFVTSLSSGRHRVHRTYIGGFVKDSIYDYQVPSDVIGQDPSQYSATTLVDMKQHQRTTPYELDEGYTQVKNINFLASREWMNTEHGPVHVGIGLVGRRERVFYHSPDMEVRLGERPGYDVSRAVWATHMEVTAPTGPLSELTASLRNDQYSDFGGVNTGKLGWKWKPSRDWLVRGSVGTGFRAPTLGQMVPLITTVYDYYDAESGEYIPVVNGGNPLLRPEKSVQKTMGFRYEPNNRWSLGLDMWQVVIEDTFGVLTEGQILNIPQLKAKYLVDGNIQQINQNLGSSLKRGIDFDVNWRQPTDMGRFRVNLKGTHMLKSVTEDAVSGVSVSNIANSAQPLLTTARNQWTWGVFLERPEWVGGFMVHYKSGYEEKTVLTDVDGNTRNYTGRIPGHWTLDFLSRWQIQPNLSFSANLINATNRMPALRMALHENVMLGIDTRYANYMGRNLQLKLNYKF